MPKPNILCIDDTPNQIIDTSANTTLKQILEGIYKSSPYEVVFETFGEKGIDAAKKDKDIKLVLLDIEFNRQKKQGDEIAKNLIATRPELKVIVLTRVTKTGTKISLGHKRNVVHYVIKKELSFADIQRKLKNLSHAVIEDYGNKGWRLEYDGKETITLSNGKESFGVNIPITAKQAIQDCMSSPNRPVNVALPSDQLNKAHNMINNNVREGTDWNTWGILTKEGCAKGQLKLVIGAVAGDSVPESQKALYVSMSDFDRVKKNIESRLNEIEQKLNTKKSKEK